LLPDETGILFRARTSAALRTAPPAYRYLLSLTTMPRAHPSAQHAARATETIPTPPRTRQICAPIVTLYIEDAPGRRRVAAAATPRHPFAARHLDVLPRTRARFAASFRRSCHVHMLGVFLMQPPPRLRMPMKPPDNEGESGRAARERLPVLTPRYCASRRRSECRSQQVCRHAARLPQFERRRIRRCRRRVAAARVSRARRADSRRRSLRQRRRHRMAAVRQFSYAARNAAPLKEFDAAASDTASSTAPFRVSRYAGRDAYSTGSEMMRASNKIPRRSKRRQQEYYPIINTCCEVAGTKVEPQYRPRAQE